MLCCEMISKSSFLISALLFLVPDFSGSEEPEEKDIHQDHGQTIDETIRHVVLLQFIEDADPDLIPEIEQAFVALKDKIDFIEDLEWGLNDSPEEKNDGFTHCFFLSFKSMEDLKKYGPHPAHQAFVALLKPQLKKVLVFDYKIKASANDAVHRHE